MASVLNTALSALIANQAALKTTSDNIANVNTQGYQRRVVQQQAAVAGGQLAGVQIAEVRRIAATFFARESLTTGSLAARAAIEADLHARIQSLFGRPDDGSSIAAQLSSAMGAFSDAAIDPTSMVRRNAALSALSQTLDSFSNLAQRLQDLRSDADNQIAAKVASVNTLLDRIYDLNLPIAREILAGNTATGLADQRDQAIRELAQYLDIRADEQPDGRVFISTPSGVSLVSNLPAELRYKPAAVVTAGSTFDEIVVQRLDPDTGANVGNGIALDSKLDGGEIAGLLAMRNTTLSALAEETGALAGAFADRLNAVHNDAVSVPPVNTLTGRNTGLLAGDALNFTGAATLAVLAADGTLVRRVDVDFDASTYSVDGGAAVAIGGATISDLVSALNTALAGAGSASFSAGVLSVSASLSTNGVAFQQDAANPSARGGRGFSHFFGLNDLVEAKAPLHADTGLSAADAHGFTNGETVAFALRRPDGSTAFDIAYTISGTTIGDVVSGLNAAFGGRMTFSLDGNGALQIAPGAGYDGYSVAATDDQTARGATGMGVAELFGIGSRYVAERAADMEVREPMASNPSRLALAQLDLPSATPGAFVLGAADNRGALALANAENEVFAFGPAGFFGAVTTSIGNYAATLLADAGQRAALSETSAADLGALRQDVENRRSGIEGVNLDEELANMMTYQQAYNAGARLIKTAQELMDALLSVV